MKIIVATDTWTDINGVSRTLSQTFKQLRKNDLNINIIHPGLFKSIACPLTSDIRLSWYNSKVLSKLIKEETAIHIATEGPIGFGVRNYCIKNNLKFTTSYCTNFPEYLNINLKIPINWGFKYFKWFHSKSSCVMISTNSLKIKLEILGFKNLGIWSRGVDLKVFQPLPRMDHESFAVVKKLPREKPIATYVGRISKEKNIEGFLDVPNDVIKVVIGEGPHLKYLQNKYPHVYFAGKLTGERLYMAYANSDVFVFPSKTDTFGNVMLEALASGVPIAAYPVNGPLDIIGGIPHVGCLADNLEDAIDYAICNGKKEACVELASKYSWEVCTNQFLENLVIN